MLSPGGRTFLAAEDVTPLDATLTVASALRELAQAGHRLFVLESGRGEQAIGELLLLQQQLADLDQQSARSVLARPLAAWLTFPSADDDATGSTVLWLPVVGTLAGEETTRELTRHSTAVAVAALGGADEPLGYLINRIAVPSGVLLYCPINHPVDSRTVRPGDGCNQRLDDGSVCGQRPLTPAGP